MLSEVKKEIALLIFLPTAGLEGEIARDSDHFLIASPGKKWSLSLFSNTAGLEAIKASNKFKPAYSGFNLKYPAPAKGLLDLISSKRGLI